jgi:predicted  nucleic acid-binding Zn-ribbon protein
LWASVVFTLTEEELERAVRLADEYAAKLKKKLDAAKLKKKLEDARKRLESAVKEIEEMRVLVEYGIAEIDDDRHDANLGWIMKKMEALEELLWGIAAKK